MKLSLLPLCISLLTSSVNARWFRGGSGGAGGNGGRTPVTSSLSEDEKEDLLFMREEEKVARDVYLTLHERWNEPEFANIANSEQTHMDRMLQMISRYGLTDPIKNPDNVGSFTNQGLQEMYDGLITKGNQSLLEAFKVGTLIEEVDIDDLENAILETEKKTLQRVYGNLKDASYKHLRAFVSRIEDIGVTYEAQWLSQEEVDVIVN